MPQLLGRLEGGLVGRQALPDGAGLLGPQVQGHVLLGLVELTQVLLLLLGHDDVDPGDGLADDADLGKFGGSATGHLGNTELGQLVFEVFQLLGQLLLLLSPQLRALDLTHRESVIYKILSKRSFQFGKYSQPER